MGLFLSIYKKQISIVVVSLIVIGTLSILNFSEALMFMLITFGIAFSAVGAYSMLKHLSTPSTFRSCDRVFFRGLFSLLLAGVCTFEFVQLLIK